MAIDGELGEWGCSEPAVCPGITHRHYYSGWKGPNNLKVTGRLMWDEEHLYCVLDIVDDVFVLREPEQRAADGASIAFHLPTKTPHRLFLISKHVNEGPIVMHGHGSTERVPEVSTAMRYDGDEYRLIYELSIPCAVLGHRPQSGRDFRCTFAVRD